LAVAGLARRTVFFAAGRRAVRDLVVVRERAATVLRFAGLRAFAFAGRFALAGLAALRCKDFDISATLQVLVACK
jgi:hypothetical protein